MSTINSLTSTSTPTSAATPKTQLAGTQDEFLKMFMAQLQNQDPLQPQDNSQMVAQLAQFSSLEQAQQTNQQLSALTASQASAANASLSSLVGRSCSAAVGDVNIQNPSQIPPIEVAATSGSPKGSSIVVTDANGKEIRRIAVPDNGGTVQWDGRDSSGNLVQPGAYHVAVDTGSSTADVTANWKDNIDSVQLDATGSRLQMGGITIAPSTITSIGATSTTPTGDAITTALNASAAPQGSKS